METVLNIIQTVGFPIAACVFLGYYLKHITDTYRNDVKEITDKYEKAIDRFSKSIDKNTGILTTLSVKLENGEIK